MTAAILGLVYPQVGYANTPTDVAAQANITFIQVTGHPDRTFSRLQYRYSPARSSLSIPGKWAGFCRQGGRNITFNLGTWKYVQSVSLSFEQNQFAGTYWPSYMTVLTSQDGRHWSAFGESPVTTSVNGNIETLTIDSSQPVMSAYMKIIFPVKYWVFCGQLHIWNQPAGASNVTPPFVQPPQPAVPKGFLAPGNVNGVHHMLLAYSGSNGSLGEWSTQDFLPMLDYVDPHGVAESRLFDTVLFLPYKNAGQTMAGWEGFLQDLFAPNGELANLNAAAQKAGPLIYSTITENVVVAIPNPSPDTTNFGAVNTGGSSLDFNPQDVGESNSLQNRETAIDWYYNQLQTMWKQTNFSNLHLSGVYWNEETFKPGTDDTQLVEHLHAETQKDGLSLIWIPFYGAAGASSWQSNGFDGAILQSNYYETPAATGQRIKSTVEIANGYGLGVEVELDSNALTNTAAQTRYANELAALTQDIPSATTLTTAYYDGSKVLLSAYQSTDPAVRKLYDETGLWVQRH